MRKFIRFRALLSGEMFLRQIESLPKACRENLRMEAHQTGKTKFIDLEALLAGKIFFIRLEALPRGRQEGKKLRIA